MAPKGVVMRILRPFHPIKMSPLEARAIHPRDGVGGGFVITDLVGNWHWHWLWHWRLVATPVAPWHPWFIIIITMLRA